ncbi:MAG: UDP-glucose/GDP-mannose dehydrogenase family protein [Candidatus Aureabacteria bacterium]|nr:UDP-glucose/GDP-mannose dehydrogenase family protein [Candidatus Auribacterota bacterium]
MKICVIGTGYVGLVTGTCLAETGNTVICVDNDKSKILSLKNGVIPIYEPELEEFVKKNIKEKRLTFTTDIQEGVNPSQIIFICVSTPPRADGSADLSFVENVARSIALYMNEYKIIIDKSTVPVETGQRVEETIKRQLKDKNIEFDVVSNPEFLREGSAIHDSMKPDRIVIGVSSQKAADILTRLYEPFQAKIIITNIKSAEIIKHASNSFLATKISFINEVSRICELSGANIEEVALGMGLDPRIGRQFLQTGIGYGGSCFPKDVSAFIKISEELGYDFKILKAVEKVNAEQIEFFIKKIEKTLWIIKDKKITVWGLAFKPDTDDMRNAPSIQIIEALVKDGAEIHAYDPVAMEKARSVLPEDVVFHDDIYSSLQGSEALVIATEWEDFKNADLDRVMALMEQPIVVDGRNIFDPSLMKEKGFMYTSIGR